MNHIKQKIEQKTYKIPVQKRMPSKNPYPSLPYSSLSKPSILYVENEPSYCQSLQEMLKESFEIHCESSPQKALLLLQKKKFPIVMCSQSRSINSIAFLKQVRKIHSDSIRMLVIEYLQEPSFFMHFHNQKNKNRKHRNQLSTQTIETNFTNRKIVDHSIFKSWKNHESQKNQKNQREETKNQKNPAKTQRNDSQAISTEVKKWELENILWTAMDSYFLLHLTNSLREKLQKQSEKLQKTQDILYSTREKLLKEAGKSGLRILSAGLSHEIKTQLLPISLLEFLREEVSIEGKGYIKEIFQSRDRILRWIEEIQSFYKNEEKDSKKNNEEDSYRLKPENIKEVIEETLALCRLDPDVKFKKIFLDLEYSGRVFIHRDRIIQVLLNLIRNSAHAIDAIHRKKEEKKDGWIRIRVQMEKKNKSNSSTNFLSIQIIDNGKGISKERNKKIWDAFYTTKESSGSMGVGLDIVKRIVEGHRGKITCSSVLDKGTCFSFTVPIAEQRTQKKKRKHKLRE